MSIDTGKTEQQAVKRMNAPANLFGIRSFFVEDCLRQYTSSNQNFEPVLVSFKSQKESLYEMLSMAMGDEPTTPYTCCISSLVDDTRAKLLAYNIARTHSSRGKPWWHRLQGGYGDALLTAANGVSRNLDMLIVYNIMGDSDNYRKGKLRDLLEHYCNIPRIVVTSNVDPINLFIDIGYPLDYPIFLKSEIRTPISGK